MQREILRGMHAIALSPRPAAAAVSPRPGDTRASNTGAAALTSAERHVAHLVDLDGMLGNLRDLGGPRVAGTESARRAAELLRTKADAIEGWDVRIETLKGASRLGTIPIHNVIAEKRGTNPDGQRGLVVGGAHFDTVPGSPGANDDGSGSVALLEAAQALATKPTKHDVRLVWFDGEEVGLVGSKAHVKANAADTPRTLAMIQAEMLGSPHGSPVMLFGGSTDARAGAPVVDIAAKLGINLEVSKDRPYGSDHNPFADAGMPSMVVSTTAPPPRRILHDDPHYHSPNDTVANLNKGDLSRMADLVATSVYAYANEPGRIAPNAPVEAPASA